MDDPSDGRKLSRRQFLKLTTLAALVPAACSPPPNRTREETKITVNDVHSQLNETPVERVVKPESLQELRTFVTRRSRQGEPICVSGSRHSMGGQQFRRNAALIDARGLNRVLDLDPERGIARVEAGAQWPELIRDLNGMQPDATQPWTIRQKQTGADRLTVGGAVSVNAHGRGLTWQPMIQDVEALTLVTPDGNVVTCSRDTNPQLFRLAVGGYGLFGTIYSVQLRLMRRTKLERVVQIKHVDNIMEHFNSRIENGFTYGDFQFSIDDSSQDFLKRGVFSCYRPVDVETPIPERQRELSREQWLKLIRMAHEQEGTLFDFYSQYYLSTSGQMYWSDNSQLSVYLRDYHQIVNEQFENGMQPGTEMITELYVPRDQLAAFMHDVADYLRQRNAEVVYGTVRLIEEDTESFLPWARQDYACIVLNLHVNHSESGIQKAKTTFRGLIDRALDYDGNFFLTYHRWATDEQIRTGYPEMSQFLQLKREHDPREIFQSDWYMDMKSRQL